MTLRLSQYTPPTAEPIHLTEAKIHLHYAVDAASAALFTAKDADIIGWLSGAMERAEAETWLALVLQVWDIFLDAWPSGDEIRLPKPPLRKVEFIKYTDADGTVNTFAATEYEVDTDSTPGRIVLGYNKSWPDDTLTQKNPIQIRFRCGYVVPFTAVADTDVVTAMNHPYVNGDKLRLSVSGGVLPTGLEANKDYFARDVSGDTLKLAATADGDAINLTSAGSGNMFLGVVPAGIVQGMKLLLTYFNNEGENEKILSAASRMFAMNTAKTF